MDRARVKDLIRLRPSSPPPLPPRTHARHELPCAHMHKVHTHLQQSRQAVVQGALARGLVQLPHQTAHGSPGLQQVWTFLQALVVRNLHAARARM